MRLLLENWNNYLDSIREAKKFFARGGQGCRGADVGQSRLSALDVLGDNPRKLNKFWLKLYTQIMQQSNSSI